MAKLTQKQRETRGKQAQKLLDNKLLKEAFESVKQSAHQQIEEAPPSDLETLVLCKERLHVLKSVEENIRRFIKDGKAASSQMIEEDRPPYLGDIAKWRMQKQQN